MRSVASALAVTVILLGCTGESRRADEATGSLRQENSPAVSRGKSDDAISSGSTLGGDRSRFEGQADAAIGVGEAPPPREGLGRDVVLPGDEVSTFPVDLATFTADWQRYMNQLTVEAGGSDPIELQDVSLRYTDVSIEFEAQSDADLFIYGSVDYASKSLETVGMEWLWGFVDFESSLRAIAATYLVALGMDVDRSAAVGAIGDRSLGPDGEFDFDVWVSEVGVEGTKARGLDEVVEAIAGLSKSEVIDAGEAIIETRHFDDSGDWVVTMDMRPS